MFKKAEKTQRKLRLAIFGIAGAGKTYTSLAVASGINKAQGSGKIGLIDTEYGSASLYADKFDFLTLQLKKADIDTLVNVLIHAQKEGINVLIIDSLTHSWQELLIEIDTLAKAKYKNNSWAAWSEGTPKQRKLIHALLSFDGHIIATMRSKTEWSTETTEKGNSKPVRIGTTPEQGKGIEYEFDMLIDLSGDHIANVIKDRTGKFQDKLIEKPGAELGIELYTWLMNNELPPQTIQEHEEPKTESQKSPEITGPAVQPPATESKLKTSESYLKPQNDEYDGSVSGQKAARIEYLKDNVISRLNLLKNNLHETEYAGLLNMIESAKTDSEMNTIAAMVKDREKTVDNEKKPKQTKTKPNPMPVSETLPPKQEQTSQPKQSEDCKLTPAEEHHVNLLKDRILNGLEKLKDYGWDETHIINSIRKHLGTDTVMSCNIISKLQDYFAHVANEYRSLRFKNS